MQRSVLFLRIRGTLACCQSERRHKMSAKLHCLFSQAILNMGRTRSRRTYPVACSIVYDLRRYTQRTRWGPFMDDGTDNVDWEKVEAILIVLGHNISSKRLVSRVFSDVWENPFAGSWPGSYISAPPPPPKPAAATTTAANDDNSDDEIDPDLEAQDPYGVTGTWYRVCSHPSRRQHKLTNLSLLTKGLRSSAFLTTTTSSATTFPLGAWPTISNPALLLTSARPPV